MRLLDLRLFRAEMGEFRYRRLHRYLTGAFCCRTSRLVCPPVFDGPWRPLPKPLNQLYGYVIMRNRTLGNVQLKSAGEVTSRSRSSSCGLMLKAESFASSTTNSRGLLNGNEKCRVQCFKWNFTGMMAVHSS